MNEELFNTLRRLNLKSNRTQISLAAELGSSLGKLNYCLKELKKGLVKLKTLKRIKKLTTSIC